MGTQGDTASHAKAIESIRNMYLENHNAQVGPYGGLFAFSAPLLGASERPKEA